MNSYFIDSSFGRFHVFGNELLPERVQEMQAIAQLREVVKSDLYLDALKKSAMGPLNVVKDVVTKPVQTAKAIPKGVWKFLNRAGTMIKEGAQERERNPHEETAGAELVGFGKVKRQMAFDLGIDPYTSNEVLQAELVGVARTAFAGGATFKLLTLPVGGTLESALTVTTWTGRLGQVLREYSPQDLRKFNLGKLLELGVPRNVAERFLGNPVFTPTHQTRIVAALENLGGLPGSAEFIQLTEGASDEADALYFQGTAELLAWVHGQKTRLVRMDVARGIPFAVASDRTQVVALQWDYATWNAEAAQFMRALAEVAPGEAGRPRQMLLVLTGGVSERLRKELEARGVSLIEKARPGPLK
jgi:hypothetical protein